MGSNTRSYSLRAATVSSTVASPRSNAVNTLRHANSSRRASSCRTWPAVIRRSSSGLALTWGTRMAERAPESV